MRRGVSKAGTVILRPDDLYHVACATLVPARVYGYQKTLQDVGSGGVWVYVDMVRGSCGVVLSVCAGPVLGASGRPSIGRTIDYPIHQHFATSPEFRAHLLGGKCLVRYFELGELMTYRRVHDHGHVEVAIRDVGSRQSHEREG